MMNAKLVVLLCILVQAFEVKCGSRIIGGSNAAPGSAPYMVSLRTDSFFHFCGGGIIDAQWVLTAKHCVDGSGPINVAAGSNTLNPRNIVIRSSDIIVHPTSDIALVKLSRSIQFTNLIQKLNLPSSDITPNTELRITGWGATYYDDGNSGDAPNNLQSLYVHSMTTNECARIFTGITQEVDLCTIGPRGEGICFGDSGSPLVVNNEVHGVASRTLPCAYGNPEIYAKVFYLNSWIQDTMARN